MDTPILQHAKQASIPAPVMNAFGKARQAISGAAGRALGAARSAGQAVINKDNADVVRRLSGKAVIPAAIISGIALKNSLRELSRSPKCRQIFDSLANDPQFKDVDKNTLAEWYATIRHYAPSAAEDRQTAFNLLKQFATFGTIDIQTVKMLSEIEKNHTTADKNLAHWLDWMM